MVSREYRRDGGKMCTFDTSIANNDNLGKNEPAPLVMRILGFSKDYLSNSGTMSTIAGLLLSKASNYQLNAENVNKLSMQWCWNSSGSGSSVPSLAFLGSILTQVS
ncbi:hypothetical protein QYF36_014962 [Acer negundo]|nr:hypothetical protein QYF36_014962 [Acer negundo]